ncbi:MAG: ATP-binding protein [Chloroflexi bacterium]|nr:ATP-binding protein [Chloroflexota bacterium]
MTINREQVRQLLHAFRFQEIFIQALNWSFPPDRRPLTVLEGWQCRPIAELHGVTVFEVFHPERLEIPDAKMRRAIHDEVACSARENLLIFLDSDRERTQSLWYWLKRDEGKLAPREHIYLRGQPGDLFLSKIANLFVTMEVYRDEQSVEAACRKLSSAFDILRVTRRFYEEFRALREEIVPRLEGLPTPAERSWYASVLLNRLMFIYFLQKKGFLQGDLHYLENQLRASRARGPDRFYSEFLKTLFFEGFAKPPAQRSPQARQLLGEIKYLNGGLFLPHELEQKYPHLVIPDRVFEAIFNLFGRYSWYLNDTPGEADNEINPDVLGYIFEKYINQKAFGAYYTRSEITDYLCERTIHAALLDRLNARLPTPLSELGEAFLSRDPHLISLLLEDILPTFSILDPACGSGAFLLAAMRTLLDIYGALIGKAEVLHNPQLDAYLRRLDAERGSAPRDYLIRKRIIVENLYGVDIMPEAVEIARLRMFLGLVGIAERVEQLEPLPNIDFNIMAGNALIGLLRVDASQFDQRAQKHLFGAQRAQRYADLLREKNRLIALYRTSSSLTQDLTALRERIAGARRAHYQVLNELLLEEFQHLGIKYEQAQPSGKPLKRPLTADDIAALQPFHWGYDFDSIVAERGGFDVVLTNPPWEVLKPEEKEFLRQYDDSISKKKMTIKEFERERERLMRAPEVQREWLALQSRFALQSAYFRAAPHYKHQSALANGKRTGSDLNYYKLFTERCFNLARAPRAQESPDGGHCGLVIPSGIYTDLGAKGLRQLLFERARISGLFCFENREAIFEGVHRSFKFVLLTFGRGGGTERFRAAFMRHDVNELREFMRRGGVEIHVPTVRRLSPESLSILEFKGARDAEIAQKMSRFPLLSAWQIKFSNEFHMTNDSHLFRTEPAAGRLPLYEGKMIHQFTHQWNDGALKYWVDEREGRAALLGRRADRGQRLGYQDYRLAFRGVARSTDERTMIAALIPPAFHGNSLPTVEIYSEDGARLISDADQLYLCAVFNSFVFDYLLRLRVSANLNFFYIYQMPVPRLAAADGRYAALVERAARLTCTAPEFDGLARAIGLGDHRAGAREAGERARLRAELDALVAQLYGLDEAEFAHVLAAFPLVAEPVKAAALAAYRELG